MQNIKEMFLFSRCSSSSPLLVRLLQLMVRMDLDTVTHFCCFASGYSLCSVFMLEVHSHLIDVLHPSVLLPSIKVPVNISMHDRDRNVSSFSNCQDKLSIPISATICIQLAHFRSWFCIIASQILPIDRLVIETDLLSSASEERSSKRYGENGLSDREGSKIYEKDHIQMKRRKGSQSVMLFCGDRERIKGK